MLVERKGKGFYDAYTAEARDKRGKIDVEPRGRKEGSFSANSSTSTEHREREGQRERVW